MFPTGDVGGAIGAFTVADGEVDDLSVQLCRAEDQVKIAEGIEISEVGTVGGDLFVIFTPHYFCTAQRILDGLSQQP